MVNTVINMLDFVLYEPDEGALVGAEEGANVLTIGVWAEAVVKPAETKFEVMVDVPAEMEFDTLAEEEATVTV